jgi:hypothetical protein
LYAPAARAQDSPQAGARTGTGVLIPTAPAGAAFKKIMKLFFTVTVFGAALLARAGQPANSDVSVAPNAAAVETIVYLRHGEKPSGGPGQSSNFTVDQEELNGLSDECP